MTSKQEYNRKYRIDKQTELQMITKTLTCACCGKQPIQLDHIVPVVYHHKYGYKSRERLAAPARLHDFKAGKFQPLCSSCNLSKGTGVTCMLHEKYLGVWNYLPPLDDLEVG